MLKKIFHTKKNIQVRSWFQDFIARNTVVQSDFNYDIWFWKYNCVVPWLIGTHVTPNSPPFITPTLDCLMHSYLWKDTILAWLCVLGKQMCGRSWRYFSHLIKLIKISVTWSIARLGLVRLYAIYSGRGIIGITQETHNRYSMWLGFIPDRKLIAIK